MFNTVKSIVIVCCLFSMNNGQQCSGPPPYLRKPQECCQYPYFFNETVRKNCQHHGDQHCDPPAKDSPQTFRGCCGIECKFKETGLYIEDGVVNQSNLLSVFTAALNGDLDLISDLTLAVNLCFTQVAKRASEFSTTYSDIALDGSPNCHPVTTFLLKCIQGNMIANCPGANFASGDAECVELKQYFTSCPNGPQ